MVKCVHIIDPDHRRRASVAREFLARGYHAEIYESVSEFFQSKPQDGITFALDVSEQCEAAALLKASSEQRHILPVAFYSPEVSTSRIVSAMRLGAIDYLEYPFDTQMLNDSLRRLTRDGEQMVERARKTAHAKAQVDVLSRRERQVLLCVMSGYSNKDTAKELGISSRTVEIHRGNMMGKLNAKSASDAVRLGMYAGLEPDLTHTRPQIQEETSTRRRA
jgi:two-component system, LuxR family, response regulator FixJ